MARPKQDTTNLTIRISEKTRKNLEYLGEAIDSESYTETIRRIAAIVVPLVDLVLYTKDEKGDFKKIIFIDP